MALTIDYFYLVYKIVGLRREKSLLIENISNIENERGKNPTKMVKKLPHNKKKCVKPLYHHQN